MGKYKHPKAIGLLHISCEELIHTIPKAVGLLYISCEALIHTIPKIWEK